MGPTVNIPSPRRRSVVKSASIYALGTIMGRLVSFALLPLYTSYLTPADYGLITMLTLTSEVVNIVITVGQTAGISRFYLTSTDETYRRRLVSTAFLTQFGLATLGMLIFMALASPIQHILLNGLGSPTLVRLAALNYMLTLLPQVPEVYLQINERPRAVAGLTLARVALQLGLNVCFVAFFHLGPLGILLSTAIAFSVTAVPAVIWLLRQTGVHYTWPIAGELRRFGFPLQISAVGSFIISFGDRFFLEHYSGIAAVGLYAFAYQFGFALIALTSVPYNKAWVVRRYQFVDHPKEERDRQYGRGFLVLTSIVVMVATAMTTLSEPIVRTMAKNPAFYPAARLIPIVVAAYVFASWKDIVYFGIGVSKRTWFAVVESWASAALMLVLYWVLIPRWGAAGAAVATLIGLAFRCSLVFAIAQRVWPVDYQWRLPLQVLAIGVAAGLLSLLTTGRSVIVQASFGALLVAAAAITIYTLVWPVDLRRETATRLFALAARRRATA
jgi:O-antigen/teichoic acid export membrane protein